MCLIARSSMTSVPELLTKCLESWCWKSLRWFLTLRWALVNAIAARLRRLLCFTRRFLILSSCRVVACCFRYQRGLSIWVPSERVAKRSTQRLDAYCQLTRGQRCGLDLTGEESVPLV